MTPQELKNSILQRAIQGKLVEQRPEEGTAQELYQQIQAEKEALRKAGKLKKEKPLPEIAEDEKPFDIPESWMWVRVRDCISNRAGLAYDKGNLSIKSAQMIRVLRGGNILDMGYALKPDDVMISSEFVKPELYLTRNTIITPAVTSLDHVGKMGRIERDYSDVVVGGFVLMLSPHLNNDTFSQYLMNAFSSKFFRDSCRGIVNKSGQAFYNLSREKMMSLTIPLPPLEEQKRIVAKIEELLPLIDRYEAAWSRLEEFNKRFPGDMQKSLLQMAIQGKLVEQRPEEGTAEALYNQIQAEKQALLQAGKIKKEKPLPPITDDEKPFDIPESWKWVRLTELGSFSSGKTPTMGEAKYWNNGMVQWFTSKDMKKKYLDVSEMQITELAASGMTRYPAGTLLMVVRSGILKRMLPLCILTQESTINQDIKAYRLFDLSISEYVYYMIKGLETHILENYRKQVTTVDSLKFDEFSREMLVPLPPLAEQKRIVTKLEELLPLCERLK